MYIIHNKTISDVVTDSYLSVDIYNIFSLLYHHGTFEFNVLENGFFQLPICHHVQNIQATDIYGYVITFLLLMPTI